MLDHELPDEYNPGLGNWGKCNGGSAVGQSSATRIDRATGIEMRIEHILTPRGFLYSVSCAPPRATSYVVMCSSICGDFLANYHRERDLALALPPLGIGVIRFHNFGEGNSAGDRSDMTLSTLCEDAAIVVEHAMSNGASDLAIVGTRLGALAAAAISSRMPQVPLVLWQPVIEPLKFITEARRAARMSDLSQGGDEGPTDWETDLIENGMLDLLGYDVHRPLIESFRGVNAIKLLGDEPRRMLLTRFKGQRGFNRELATLRDQGFAVTDLEVDLSEPWFFDRETKPESADLIPTTAGWLVDTMPARKDQASGN